MEVVPTVTAADFMTAICWTKELVAMLETMIAAPKLVMFLKMLGQVLIQALVHLQLLDVEEQSQRPQRPSTSFIVQLELR